MDKKTTDLIALSNIYNYLAGRIQNVSPVDAATIEHVITASGSNSVKVGPIIGRKLLRIISDFLNENAVCPELCDALASLGLKGRAMEGKLVISGQILKKSKKPNVILYNLQNSGSSAIDPIMREILSIHFDYDVFFDPTCSEFFSYFSQSNVPTYHWTHSEYALFSEIGRQDDLKILCLIRDPRDVLISFVKDQMYVHQVSQEKERQYYLDVTQHQLPKFLDIAIQWYTLNRNKCHRIRFDDMKKDTLGTVVSIFKFIGLDVPDEIIQKYVDKYSFENVTKRNRGDEGQVIRTGYLYRKGVSGEWRNYFDEELKKHFKQFCGRQLVALGYEENNEW